MKNAIEIKGLNKTLGDFNLKNINLVIPEGSIVGLIGENGAGKTTLIESILNIYKKDSGEIRIYGIDNTSDEYAKVKENISVVFDDISLNHNFNAININKIMKLAYRDWDESTFYYNLNKFGLGNAKKIKNYSAGMKKKLALAIAFSHNSRLLILDEPTSNLDPIFREEIIDELGEFTRDENHTILISSHILSDLEKLCDYIAFIHMGEIVLFEEKDELLNRYSLYRVKHSDLVKIPEEYIVNTKITNYGYELLAERKYVPEMILPEFTSLEDIVLNLVKSKRK